MERIPLEPAGPDLQSRVGTPEGKGKMQRVLPASSTNREILGFHLLQQKEFVPLQYWPFSELGLQPSSTPMKSEERRKSSTSHILYTE